MQELAYLRDEHVKLQGDYADAMRCRTPRPEWQDLWSQYPRAFHQCNHDLEQTDREGDENMPVLLADQSSSDRVRPLVHAMWDECNLI